MIPKKPSNPENSLTSALKCQLCSVQHSHVCGGQFSLLSITCRFARKSIISIEDSSLVDVQISAHDESAI